MMLPQHKERIVEHERSTHKQTKPELTDEERQEMFGKLAASKANTLEVAVTVFGEYENRVITGIVTGLDPRRHLVKIQLVDDWDLIDFADVLKVELDFIEDLKI